MIPAPWAFAILAFGAYRLTRLVGWDDWPPIAKLRARVLGERGEWICSTCPAGRDDYERRGDGVWVGLEGCPNCGSGESPMLETTFDRPVFAHLVGCPFCVGWWISVAVYTGWLFAPRWTLLVLAPLALSGVVGLVAKNLDP